MVYYILSTVYFHSVGVCRAGVIVVGVVGVGEFMAWAMCCLCCVFCGIVLDCGILALFLPHCNVYCRVPGLRYSGGLIGTWSVCLSTVSFPL